MLLFAAYIVVMNWGCVDCQPQEQEARIDRHHSTVPLVSFFITIVGMAAYPWRWMMTVLLLDITNWSLLWLPFGLIRELRSKKTTEPRYVTRPPGTKQLAVQRETPGQT